MSGQVFVEQAILLHVMENDTGEADRKLTEFLTGELADFLAQVNDLADLIRAELRSRREKA